MPAEVLEDPLRVRFVFSSGTECMIRFPGLARTPLLEQLAAGLAYLAVPHGGLDAPASAAGYRARIGQLVRWLDRAGFTGRVGDLTVSHLVGFWRSGSPQTEAATRQLLRSVDRHVVALRPEVREVLAGNALQPRRKSAYPPLAPYSDTEWDRLIACCRRVITTARGGHHAALAAAAAGQDPASAGWSRENVLWLLHRDGPLTKERIAERLGVGTAQISKWGGASHLARALFVTRDVVVAYRLLLGAMSGIVPDGIDELDLSDIDWAGDTTVLLAYIKDRTGPESLNLPRPAVMVLRQWLAHSAELRRFVPEPIRDRLWVSFSPMGDKWRISAPSLGPASSARFVVHSGLVDDRGAPFSVHKGRIRTTFHARRDKSRWTGRTTIDPNHSARVEGDHYLAAPTPAQRDALEAIVEQAQGDLVRRSLAPLVIATDTAQTATSLPETVSQLGLGDEVLRELLGGRRDVFTAACIDPLAGLHGPAGKPCPARPWVCLLCPLALFAPRHLPNLLRLKAFFARQFNQMTASQFLAVFGAYAQRLDEILPLFAPALIAAATAAVQDSDAELPLRAEETTG